MLRIIHSKARIVKRVFVEGSLIYDVEFVIREDGSLVCHPDTPSARTTQLPEGILLVIVEMMVETSQGIHLTTNGEHYLSHVRAVALARELTFGHGTSPPS
jgi:hypothetical protein